MQIFSEYFYFSKAFITNPSCVLSRFHPGPASDDLCRRFSDYLLQAVYGKKKDFVIQCDICWSCQTCMKTFSASSAMSVFSQMMSDSFLLLISLRQCSPRGWMPSPLLWR